MKLSIFLASGALLLAGCESGDIVLNAKARADAQAGDQRRGAARVIAFRECMELAAKMPRQADDDVSDIVQECSTQALYLTNYLK